MLDACFQLYPLPYKPDQIEDLLYKLTLEELLQVSDITKLKAENIQRFLLTFAYHHPSSGTVFCNGLTG